MTVTSQAIGFPVAYYYYYYYYKLAFSQCVRLRDPWTDSYEKLLVAYFRDYLAH